MPVPDGPLELPAGLCRECSHARVIRSAKGSVFLLCRRAETDTRFAKYPPLPVWTCIGFEPVTDSEPADR